MLLIAGSRQVGNFLLPPLLDGCIPLLKACGEGLPFCLPITHVSGACKIQLSPVSTASVKIKVLIHILPLVECIHVQEFMIWEVYDQ